MILPQNDGVSHLCPTDVHFRPTHPMQVWRLQDALLLKATVLVYMQSYEEAHRCFSKARSRSKGEFRDFLGYLGGRLGSDILGRCALAYEFSDFDEEELQVLTRIVHLARRLPIWHISPEDSPSIVATFD